MYLSLQSFLEKQKVLALNLSKIIDFLFGWFLDLSPMMQSILVIGMLFLAIIGIISLVKWSVKVLFPFAVVGIFIILLYVFVLK